MQTNNELFEQLSEILRPLSERQMKDLDPKKEESILKELFTNLNK